MEKRDNRSSNEDFGELLDSLMKHLEHETKVDYMNWISFLTQGNKVELNMMIEYYEDTGSWGSATMRYRENIRQRGRGNVEDADILNAFNNKDIEMLSQLLSEKCLQCLENRDIRLFLKYLNNREWTMQKVLHKLQRRPQAKLLSLVR